MSGRLDTSGIARLLNVSPSRARRLRTDPGFPEPTHQDEQGSEYWDETHVLRWAAGQEDALAAQAPLLYRPTSGHAASYQGTTEVNGAVMLSWDGELGRVGFIYVPGSVQASEAQRRLKELVQGSDADILVGVNGVLWNMWGPELCAVDAARPDRLYTPRWTDVRQAIGMPVPFWGSGLVQPQEMARWRPGYPPAVLPVRRLSLNTDPLLRLFANSPDDSTRGQVALALAREIDRGFCREVVAELAALERTADRSAIAVAATAEPMPLAPDLDEVVLRDGWAQILARTDQLARDCVKIALSWNGGRYFPYSDFAELDPHRSPAREFISRLQPVSATAGHSIIDRTAVRTWSDPATDAPAITSNNGKVYAAVPFRIPSTGTLAQVILRDEQVWIRTSDGSLYLAPSRMSNGLAWGYAGNGPSTLAEFISLLLDDIATPALHSSVIPDDLPRGLLELIKDVPQNEGAVLTRAQLLAACNEG